VGLERISSCHAVPIITVATPAKPESRYLRLGAAVLHLQGRIIHSVIPNKAEVIPNKAEVIPNKAEVIPNKAEVILSEAKNLSISSLPLPVLPHRSGK